jgi:hypothetical protein
MKDRWRPLLKLRIRTGGKVNEGIPADSLETELLNREWTDHLNDGITPALCYPRHVINEEGIITTREPLN